MPAGRPGGAPGRVLAVDLGAARIGVAVSDSGRRVATPYEVLVRSGDPVADRKMVADLVEELAVTTVVLGLPLGLDGRVGPGAASALEELAALRVELDGPGRGRGVEVVAVDERLSTVEAHRRRVEVLTARDSSRRGGRGGRSGPPRAGVAQRRKRPVVDDAAAAVFLQAWLDGQASGELGGRGTQP